MKVIFLDVDGVLNSNDYIDEAKRLNKEGIERYVDVEKIKLLNKAIKETGAKIVLTSSWRLGIDMSNLRELLARYGIWIDATPFINHERGLEIKQWMVEHPGTDDFVILDDEIFDSFDNNLMENLIKISDGDGISLGEGLQPKDIEQVIQKLGRKLQKEDDLER